MKPASKPTQTRPISTRVTHGQYALLLRKAKAEEITLSQLIYEALEHIIESHECQT